MKLSIGMNSDRVHDNEEGSRFSCRSAREIIKNTACLSSLPSL